MLKALIIVPNQRTKDVGDLLAIARATAQKREHTHEKVNIRAIQFVASLGVYVAVYERCSNSLGAKQGKVTP